MKRLSIVVPYRNRDAHLRQFLAHIALYFARDKLDREIPYRVLVVEQENGKPFNRGALKNVGFLLGRDDSDYTCFHDVDLLPIWADYSWTDHPGPIAWYGTDVRPVSLSKGNFIANDPEIFFGGVVLAPNDAFARVNGYSNKYWGWGYEDEDLRRRFIAAQIVCDRRRGTFQPLPHDSEGYDASGRSSSAAETNRRLFESVWLSESATTSPATDDGCSNIAYEILDRQPIQLPAMAKHRGHFEQAVIRLNMQPSPDQAVTTVGVAAKSYSLGWTATIKI